MSCKYILQTPGQPLKKQQEKKYNLYVKKRENGITQNAQLKPQNGREKVKGRNSNKTKVNEQKTAFNVRY